jgi:hypothetical protein
LDQVGAAPSPSALEPGLDGPRVCPVLKTAQQGSSKPAILGLGVLQCAG